ncbi:hemin uptake protein HemP [Paroceanicella profunda]|uniref:Hemin uptake protein HemP n=1 Tax=Paroceanicella profunda TaxID=2579971 RepID=A0A5B8FXF4_9RHOB|nr:hemin uptake protein HemP [Paroceanicella profunda]QDL93596.1 hemin uptake protein HemP [Paroceanicella profunda]
MNVASIADASAAHAIANSPCVHDARVLTDGGREARITLNGNIYTLRITRQGKLILTK